MTWRKYPRLNGSCLIVVVVVVVFGVVVVAVMHYLDVSPSVGHEEVV
jgi:hypothetical protein